MPNLASVHGAVSHEVILRALRPLRRPLLNAAPADLAAVIPFVERTTCIARFESEAHAGNVDICVETTMRSAAFDTRHFHPVNHGRIWGFEIATRFAKISRLSGP